MEHIVLHKLADGFRDAIISDAEWSMYENYTRLAHQPGWLNQADKELNQSDSETESASNIARLIQIKETVSKRIKQLLDYSAIGFGPAQLEVMHWACRTFEPPVHVEDRTRCHRCIFTDEYYSDDNPVFRAQFRVMNSATLEIETSPVFYYSAEFTTIVMCWTLLYRFDDYVRRISLSCDHEHERQDSKYSENKRLLLNSVNDCALVIYNMFRLRRLTRCQRSVFQFRPHARSQSLATATGKQVPKSSPATPVN